MLDEEYWLLLVDNELHIGSDMFVEKRCESFTLPPEEIARLRREVESDGYIRLDPEVLPWAVDMGIMAKAVLKLLEAGWDPLWLLVFDETWVLQQQISKILELVFGNANIFDFYAWYVDPRDTQAGWSPHRDRGESDPLTSFRADGTPKMNTIWIPLTDATPDNSCLYVLPATWDPRYRDVVEGPAASVSIFGTSESFQHIRCVPAKAGSAVCFTHRLLHWGSRGKTTAANPRIALSYAASTDDFEEPYFPRSFLPSPPLDMRVALAAGQMICYYAQVPVAADVLASLYTVFMYQHCNFTGKYVSKVREAHAHARHQHATAAARS